MKIEDAAKVPDTSGRVEKTDYNAKTIQIEDKRPSIKGLATTSALKAVEKKTPNANDLVKKTDYAAKISDIETKSFTTSEL